MKIKNFSRQFFNSLALFFEQLLLNYLPEWLFVSASFCRLKGAIFARCERQATRRQHLSRISAKETIELRLRAKVGLLIKYKIHKWRRRWSESRAGRFGSVGSHICVYCVVNHMKPPTMSWNWFRKWWFRHKMR